MADSRDSVDEDGFHTVHVKKSVNAGKGVELKDLSSRASVDEDGFKTVHTNVGASRDVPNFDVAAPGEEDDGSHSELKPDVALAWEFFHALLPHRVVDPKQPTGHRLNLPGEARGAGGEPAVLYNTLCAEFEQLFEFGVGVALYFGTVKIMFFTFLVMAALSFVAMNRNKDYNPDDTTRLLEGSTYGATADSLSMGAQGLFNLLVTLVLVVVLVASGVVQRRTAHKIDKNLLTPSDYTVVVDNPPRNVSDPSDYQRFFSKFGDVVLVTIALNNGDLVRSLTAKKVVQSQVNSQTRYKELAQETKQYYQDQQNLTTLQLALQPYGMYPTLGSVSERLEEVTKSLLGFAQKDYHPWRVYVTFSHQAGMSKCLHKTSLSYFSLISGSAPGSEANFHSLLLNISRAPEPTDIIFENSDYTKASRWARTLVSYVLCGAVLALCFVVVEALSALSSGAVAVFISFTNGFLPFVVMYTTTSVEIHVKKSDMEMSTLLKLVVMRCVSAGVLIYLTANETDRFGSKHLAHIQSILVADAVTTPVLRYLDIPGMMNRHVLSRGVGTQEEMNVLFTPTTWTLAERYTDVLKTVFVGTFFAVPMPSGVIITACAMFSSYWVDKYSLFHLWQRPPSLDDKLATTSRFFFALIVFAHISVSKNYFAHWPFDEASVGRDCGLLFCSTDSAMTSDQKLLTQLYNGLTIAAFASFLLVFIVMNGGQWLLSLFSENTGNIGIGSVLDVEHDISYRELAGSSAYVPVLEPAEVADPIIFSNIGSLPTKFLPLHRSNLFEDNAVDPASYSMATVKELPSIDDEKTLQSLFTQVVYYEAQGATFVPYRRPTFVTSSAFAQRTNQPTRAAASAAAVASGADMGSALPLPPGWDERRTKAGKLYYANSVMKSTTWTRPKF